LRFQHASNERQWKDIGFCLSRLSFGTEKSIKKLMEYLPLYQDKLYVPELYKNLTDIVAKVSLFLSIGTQDKARFQGPC
jgi:condensin complex subunit 1